MTLTSILTIFSTLLSPFIAVYATKFIEKHNEKTKIKNNIFFTLMAKREIFILLAPISNDFVQALNMIDITFRNNKEKQIIKAWQSLLSALNTQTTLEKKQEYFIDLLYEMSKNLGYDFDKKYLRDNAYSPQAFSNDESFNQTTKQAIMNVFTGNGHLNMKVIDFPQQELKTEIIGLINQLLENQKGIISLLTKMNTNIEKS